MVSFLAEGKGLHWCLVWGGKVRQPPPCRICLSRQFVLGLLGVTSCHIPCELHASCPVLAGFLRGRGWGPSWDLSLVTGANMAPGIGYLPWVSDVLSCSCGGVSLLMERLRSRWLPGLWAAVDHGDNIWHPEDSCFHLKHEALGGRASWHLTLTHEVLAHQQAHLALPEFRLQPDSGGRVAPTVGGIFTFCSNTPA